MSHIVFRHAITLLISTCIALLLMLGYVQTRLPPRLIEFAEGEIPAPKPVVCAGEMFTTTIHYRVNEPTVSDALVSWHNLTTRTAMSSTTVVFPGNNRPWVGSYTSTLSYTIPPLPAGQYMRVTSTTPRNRESQIDFLLIGPFTVGPCEE